MGECNVFGCRRTVRELDRHLPKGKSTSSSVAWRRTRSTCSARARRRRCMRGTTANLVELNDNDILSLDDVLPRYSIDCT